LAASLVQVRAYLATAGERLRHARVSARRHRHVLAPAALVVLGLGGALGGGALVGEWCLGLVLILESAGVVWFGLQRDDGTPPQRRGGRTVGEVLEVERRRPW